MTSPHVHTPRHVTIPPGHVLSRMPMVSALVGGIFLVASVALAVMGNAAKQFYFSWLVAFMFFLSIALGGLVFVLIQHVARAGWSVVIRRIAENFMGALPVFALLSLPIFIGMDELFFHWTDTEHAAHDPILIAKAPFLNKTFFLVRAVLYFAVWTMLAWYFRSRSVRQDATGDHEISRKLRRWAGPSLIAFALTLTFAATDWLMSLEPHWYSTIYGTYYFAGAMIAIMATLVLAAQHLQGAGFLTDEVTPEHYHDLGKLLFAFVVFWAYIAFSQFMLIWYGNIPEETVWYAARLTGSWKPVSQVLMICHFGIPFFFLMPRTLKRIRPTLYMGAVYMLVLHYVDLYWLAMPTLHPEGVNPSLLDVTCFLAVGGFFHATVTWLRGRAAILPTRDPRLPESLAFENF